MKDVVACDKLREAGKRALIRRFLNEETRPVNYRSPSAECIGGTERTQGTETSKYLEEKKETSIPSVAASESGTAQTGIRPGVAEAMRGYKTTASQSVWNVAPKRVTVP